MSTLGDRVSLNVGGHTFETSLTTMTKDPHSLLAKLAHHDLSHSRSAFIDRDGTQFRYILNFLRDGSCVLPSSEELRIEAEYFQVQGLIELMSESQEADPIKPISTSLMSLRREAQEAKFIDRLRQEAGPSAIDYVVRFLIEAAYANGLIYDQCRSVDFHGRNIPAESTTATSRPNGSMQAFLNRYNVVVQHNLRKLGYTLIKSMDTCDIMEDIANSGLGPQSSQISGSNIKYFKTC